MNNEEVNTRSGQPQPGSRDADPRDEKCSFCGRPRKTGGFFVGGPFHPRALICEACIAVCVEILAAKIQNPRGNTLEHYSLRAGTVEPQDVTLPPTERTGEPK